jgi:hypothetical protein
VWDSAANRSVLRVPVGGTATRLRRTRGRGRRKPGKTSQGQFAPPIHHP